MAESDIMHKMELLRQSKAFEDEKFEMINSFNEKLRELESANVKVKLTSSNNLEKKLGELLTFFH